MASTSSLGAKSNASNKDAQDFYESFNVTLRDARKRIEDATTEVALRSIFEEIAQARSALTATTDILPSYDRQIHEQHLREVNDVLTQKHASLAPKAKFAFKRKTKTDEKLTAMSKPKDISAGRTSPLSTASVTSNFLAIHDREGAYLTIDHLHEAANKAATDLHILDLTNCIVDLRNLGDRTEFLALQLRRLQDCVILCGRINGSTMVHDCNQCVILLESRQFRMHSSTSICVMISTSSVATIEHCKDIQFAPLDTSQALASVQDFDQIMTHQQSSDWCIMPSERQEKIRERLSTPRSDARVWIDAAGLSSSIETK